MPDLNVGGQAVIDGVMMRAKDKIATAVRVPSGEIMVKTQLYRSLASRYKVLNLPILRGAVAFVEMMIIGIKTLNFSADISIKEQERQEAQTKGEEYVEKQKGSNSFALAMSAIFAFAVGIFIFFFLPLAISNWTGIDKNAVGFNLLAGGIRLTMFVLYVWGLSLLGEFQRIFQYHGAEHKSIYAYEMGEDLLPEKAVKYTRFHPRCGTSFVLIVALLAILTYAISDTIYAIVVGHPPTLLVRFAVHFSLLPLVSGISYELLKLSGRTRDNRVTRFFIQPGLWLQKITTKEPNLEQVEVALAALEAALGVEPEKSKLTSQRTAVS
ncbi:MAG: DUF1385 domain-containing protein [bacterium]|nr:DUF1385 domain-containing protein [bacterium]